MYLVDRLWVVITTFVNVVTLSPFQNGSIGQNPLQMSSPVATPSSIITSVGVQPGPVFRPPGTPEDSTFYCNYSAMVGWVACSNPWDRKCWLERVSDGKKYDIFTDYESDAPTGITRYYELDLQDSSWDADGIDFPKAKLFNNKYPGPWIEACWGDR